MVRKTSMAVVVLAAAFILGCSKGGDEKAATVDVAAEFAKVQQARSELEVARSALTQMRTELDALKAKSKLTAEELGRKTELETQLPAAQSAFDAAYEKDQSALSAFLTLVLNDEALKGTPEARQGLRLYADGAIANATNFMDLSGDYGRAIDILETASSYYDFAGVPIPEDLQGALEKARKFRYLTKDRFDQLTKGMTEAQVKAITGTPLYANVRESQAQGRTIITWLFPRDPSVGGAAAVYFDRGKVYALKWDAAAK